MAEVRLAAIVVHIPMADVRLAAVIYTIPTELCSRRWLYSSVVLIMTCFYDCAGQPERRGQPKRRENVCSKFSFRGTSLVLRKVQERQSTATGSATVYSAININTAFPGSIVFFCLVFDGSLRIS